MPVTLTSLADIAALPADLLIDARSPSEYAEDHIPGAVSMPVLSDQERAEVGTIYKQRSPFEARKLGAALVARNVAAHLLGPLAGHDGGFRPLVYCWRGGQRSGAFSIILSQVGWRSDTIQGGYKAFRALVVDRLYREPLASPVLILDGNTGTAKTGILQRLAARGVQVLDLEGMANHRGSLFGHRAGGQPSQKAFETRLAMAVQALDPARPVVVEAESSKVGDRMVPPEIWKAMQVAPRFVIEAPRSARARYLTRAYADMTGDVERLLAVIGRLRGAHAHEVIDRWLDLARAGRFADLAEQLMEAHYDPRYERQRGRYAQLREGRIALEELDDSGLDRAAAAVEGFIARRFPDPLHPGS